MIVTQHLSIYRLLVESEYAYHYNAVIQIFQLNGPRKKWLEQRNAYIVIYQVHYQYTYDTPDLNPFTW